MTIRIYVDEDAMDKDLVRALRARGVDVLTASEASMIERTDEGHLKLAAEQGRVLFLHVQCWGFLSNSQGVSGTGEIPRGHHPGPPAALFCG